MERGFINEIAEHVRERNIPITTIFDIGANDSSESIYLSEVFPNAHIYSFEANPDMYDICRLNASISGGRIDFIPGAVSDFDGESTLNVLKSDGRQSSLFLPNKNLFSRMLNMDIEDTVTTTVTTRRLDSIGTVPDLIFMDIQGGEHKAILGLGALLPQVKVIATELLIEPLYDGAVLFDEVDRILKRDFEIVRGNMFENSFENFIYIHRVFM